MADRFKMNFMLKRCWPIVERSRECLPKLLLKGQEHDDEELIVRYF